MSKPAKAAKPAAKKPAPKPPAKAVKQPAKAAPKAAAKKAAPPPKPQPKPTRPAATAKRAAPEPKPSPSPAPSPTPSSPPPTTAPSKSTPTPSAASPTDAGVRYLTAQDLIDLHRAVSAEFGGNQGHPGVIESQYGLTNAVQRPQLTTLGREAYPTFADKAAAFLFALLQARPFRGGNRRVALASLFAFCELNNRTLDSRIFDEKAAETLVRRAASYRELGIPPENVFRELREAMGRAIV
ncbi:MAG TPA: Fic family protein [Thermoanaerobaculia bacterium]